MKYLIILLVSLPVAHAAISPSIVKDSAVKYHPNVLAALENMTAAEESVKGARGNFDAKVVSDYKRQTKHDWNATLSRTQLEKGLRIANSKVYVGSEQASSSTALFSPIYNTGYPVLQKGNYTLLGAKLSLWKNFTIDPSRAHLQNAKYDAKIAKGEKKLTVLDISRFGQLAYWEWVTAKKVMNAYENLLANGETRNEYLQARSKRGDIANIIVTENEQYVASRKGALQAAKERFLRAEYALSLFYRDNNGLPIIPAVNEEFEDYPSDLSVLLSKVDTNINVDELIQKRPDMKNLSLRIEKAETDLELAKQDLRPQIDVATEYFQRTAPNSAMPRDYLMVLGQLSIPIERNLGNGNIAAARARKMVAERHATYGRQSYRNDVLALSQSLQLRLEQVKQAEIEFAKSKELVVSETYKFKSGGGNLFLVNLREQAQASAEAGFHEARLAFMDALLSYQAIVSTGE